MSRAFLMAAILIQSGYATADDWLVSNEAEFNQALDSAVDGDRILLAPGNYAGGFYQANLTGVTIRSQDVNNPAVIVGGGNAIQLSDATRVTIEHLICQGQTGNGLNIDDGGTFATPSTELAIRHVTVRDIVGGGNKDGIKLSGVTGFLIESCTLQNWGNGGSAVDPVGSHNGLIQNCLMHHTAGGVSVSGVRPKGGSKNIVVRANRLVLDGGVGRALQAGGSTGTQFFRFIDGDSGYEAAEIKFEGNVVVGSSSPFNFVNIDGGLAHHNYAQRPQSWMLRILNENTGNNIVDTQNGTLSSNILVYNDTATEYSTDVNIGPETLPATFTFANNQWYNQADPANSQPNLPASESGGIYGIPPDVSPDDSIPWMFAWGTWAVNANDLANTLSLDSNHQYQQAIPGDDALFEPALDYPFIGDWEFLAQSTMDVELAPFSQQYFRLLPVMIGVDDVQVQTGNLLSGGLAELTTSDDQYFVVQRPEGDIVVQFEGTVPLTEPIYLQFEIELRHQLAATGRAPVTVNQTVQLMNHVTQQFETVAVNTTQATEQVYAIAAEGDLSRFVDSQGRIQSKLTFAKFGLARGLRVLIDHAGWQVLGH